MTDNSPTFEEFIDLGQQKQLSAEFKDSDIDGGEIVLDQSKLEKSLNGSTSSNFENQIEEQMKKIFEDCTQNSPTIIGIAGGISSGKTQLAKALQQQFKFLNKSQIPVLHMKFYYKQSLLNKSKTEEDPSLQCDFDSPEAFNWLHLLTDIEKLIKGQSVQQVYSDNKGQDQQKEIKPGPIIIIQGSLVFVRKQISNLCHWKIFLDTDEDIRLSRRIFQQVSLRKQRLDLVINRYLKHTKPCFLKHVFPSKKQSDIIIPNYGQGFTIEFQSEKQDEANAGFVDLEHVIIDLLMEKFVLKNFRRQSPPNPPQKEQFVEINQEKFELEGNPK